MGIDPRSTFHFVKVLTKLDLVDVKVWDFIIKGWQVKMSFSFSFLSLSPFPLSPKVMKLKPPGTKSLQSIHVVFLKRFSPQYYGFGKMSTNDQILCEILLKSPNHTAPLIFCREKMVLENYVHVIYDH